MTDIVAPASARKLPGQLVFRVAPGFDFEDIVTHRDARTGQLAANRRVDGGGRIDQAIARHSSAMRVSRAFNSRQNLGKPRARHKGWDPVEQELGLSRTFRLDVDPGTDVSGLLQDLAEVAEIEMVAPHYLCELPLAVPDAGGDETDARAMVGADRAREMEPGDSALIIGLVDSGVALEHQELEGRLRPGLNTVSAAEISAGVELLSGPRLHLQDVGDDHGHGTECASIMCGNGFRVPRGLAGASRLLPLRSLCGARMPDRKAPTAIGSLPDIDSGVKSAIDLGARVLNLSFGTPETAVEGYDYVPHIEVVRYALARDCVLVVASGNGGDRVRYYPAALPGVIAVGSVSADRRPSSFSSRGAHVVLCAPGERVACATLGGTGYTRVTGTSFAAPLVASACALMLARAARWSTPLSAMSVRGILAESASGFAAGADSSGCGAGILDVPAALEMVDERCRAASDDASIVEPMSFSPDPTPGPTLRGFS